MLGMGYSLLDGDVKGGFMSSGQVASLLEAIESAETFVKKIAEEGRQMLDCRTPTFYL